MGTAGATADDLRQQLLRDFAEAVWPAVESFSAAANDHALGLAPAGALEGPARMLLATLRDWEPLGLGLADLTAPEGLALVAWGAAGLARQPQILAVPGLSGLLEEVAGRAGGTGGD